MTNLLCAALAVLNIVGFVMTDFDPYKDREHVEGLSLFPAVGQLYMDGRAGCSAVLIEEDWALTAAHCVVDGGDFTATFDGHRREVLTVVLADQGFFSGDIALLQFEAVPVRPMPLSERSPSLRDMGKAITFVGYSQGFESYNRVNSSAYLGNMANTDLLLFVGAHIWFGDSGGATMWYEDGEHRLIGINVMLFKKGDQIVSASTRIDLHYEWIKETTLPIQG